MKSTPKTLNTKMYTTASDLELHWGDAVTNRLRGLLYTTRQRPDQTDPYGDLKMLCSMRKILGPTKGREGIPNTITLFPLPFQ
jgi:hypothetical protein